MKMSGFLSALRGVVGATVGAGLLVSISLVGVSHAADKTSDEKTINIKGKVEANCTLEVSEDFGTATVGSAISNALTNGSALSDTKVGNITQKCNKAAGYTLKVESDNCVATSGAQPVLRPSNPGDNPDEQPYTFSLVTGGTTEHPRATTNCGMTITVNGKQANRVTEVLISIPANETPVAADTYSDVLSVTLTAL